MFRRTEDCAEGCGPKFHVYGCPHDDCADLIGRPVRIAPKPTMKTKHLNIRVEQCLALSKASNCPRRKFGSLLLDPVRNVILMDGYNGGPRGGGDLCGGEVCDRDIDSIESGTHMEIGCHHAEMNVICNAAANGVACRGTWLICTGEPCLMCAKMIHHAGIVKVFVVAGGYLSPDKGLEYLGDHEVEVEFIDGPKDPRS